MTLHEDIAALTDRERTALFRDFGYVKKREPSIKRSALGAPPKLAPGKAASIANEWAEAVKAAEARRGNSWLVEQARRDVEDAARRILQSHRLSA